MSLTLTQAKALYVKAKNAYNNTGAAIMTDAKFDRLEDLIRKQDPTWSELSKTGSKTNKKTEVQHTNYMPSLSKFYPEDMGKWLTRYAAPQFVVMDKLDGSSIQVTYDNGKPVRVVTRGDGITGGDISFLIPNLNLPVIKRKGELHLRCEAIMEKKTFDKNWSLEFDNARNGVNGLLNRREPHPALADIDIVVLGVFGYPLLEGLHLATSLELPTVPFSVARQSAVDTEKLTKYLASRKSKGAYEMDGLVIAATDFMLHYENADRPKEIVAFKVNDESTAVTATVKHIVWQVTGRGRIVPKIEIDPVHVDGVTITFCTSHNAAWMKERGIGPGAQVKVLRSGGVIPRIVSVEKKGKFQPPKIAYVEDGVHFVVDAADETTQRRIDVLNLRKFMVTLGIDLVAVKTIDKMYGIGVVKTQHYVQLWRKEQLKKAFMKAGLSDKQAQNAFAEVDRVFKAPIRMTKLMTATQCFGTGIGERKLIQIEASGIDLLDLMESTDLSTSLAGVARYSAKTIEMVSDGMPAWKRWYSGTCPYLTIETGLPKKAAPKKGKLTGQFVTMTGYRDDDQVEWLEANGAEIVNFGAKTTILLHKEGGKASSKVEKAQAKGITVTTFERLYKAR